MITVNFADIPVGLDNKHGYTAALCADYLSDRSPLFTVCATEEEIAREREVNEIKTSDAYLESIVLYRKVAERLPEYDAVVFHGAVLNFEGRAYLFTARSGVGKTTHTRLWLRRFGDRVHYLNGDKPIIRFVDGIPYAYGTPYKGKEGYGVNERAPLRGIVFVERGEHNESFTVAPEDAVMKLVTQLYLPKRGSGALRALSIADRLIRGVRLVGLRCNMDVEAAEVAYRALTDEQKGE